MFLSFKGAKEIEADMLGVEYVLRAGLKQIRLQTILEGFQFICQYL